jgi:uncharacterized membrane protein YebE (DUF533 family)
VQFNISSSTQRIKMSEGSNSRSQNAAKNTAVLVGLATLGVVGAKAYQYYSANNRNQSPKRPRRRSHHSEEDDHGRRRKTSESRRHEQVDLWRKAAEGMVRLM